jgi:hypothetical protein
MKNFWVKGCVLQQRASILCVRGPYYEYNGRGYKSSVHQNAVEIREICLPPACLKKSEHAASEVCNSTFG